MSFKVGQCVHGKIAFQNGQLPTYPRFYLIIEVSPDGATLLNVSSVLGKEHKLTFKTNYNLQIYNPPFPKPTFVKLDSLTYLNQQELNKLKLKSDGKCLNESDFQNIIESLRTDYIIS